MSISKWIVGGLVVGGAGVALYLSQQPGGLTAFAASAGMLPDEEVWRRYSSSSAYTMLPAPVRPTREQFLAVWRGLTAEVKADAVRAMSMTVEQAQAEAARNPRFAASMQAMTQAMMSRAATSAGQAAISQLMQGTRGIGNYHRAR
jgi:hypothetical protein